MVHITYYSDILCVWAYIAERKLEEVRRQFGDQCEFEHRFMTLFGNTHDKFVEGWKDRGGIDGYADHVQKLNHDFDHVEIHPNVWRIDPPSTSASTHTYLSAIRLLDLDEPADGPSRFEEAITAFRKAFFEHGLNIARREVQGEIAAELALPCDEIREHLNSGAAYAALLHDAQMKNDQLIQGSPTFVLNHGRQKLYGNVGYKIIEANIRELLDDHNLNQASWC